MSRTPGWYEFWGQESGRFLGEVADDPSLSDDELFIELDEFKMRTKRFLELFYGMSEPFRVEYVPAEVVLRVVGEE